MMVEHDAATEAGEEEVSAGGADVGLQLKKRARRRLVGAAALMLLAIIGLPLVMDHAPRPPVQDIQVRIPSQDAGSLAGRLIRSSPPGTPLPAAPGRMPATAETPAEQAPVSSSVPAPTTTIPAPPSAIATVAPASKPAANPTPAPATASGTATKADKPAPAADTGATGTDSASSQWVVQLGAYKEAANVKHLQAKLKEIRLPSYTEQLATAQGPRTRVRVGPFATREAAEKARARLKIIGVDGPVAKK